MYTLNCKGKIITIDSPVVMGIINATDDSFFEGHLQLNAEQLLTLAEKMISEGAMFIDIGGQSTRPGSTRISAKEETIRVVPVIEKIHTRFPDMLISVDTYHHSVAMAAVNAGASMVNDISAGNMDSMMIPTVASLGVPYVCMHMKGTPENMQQHPTYGNICSELLDFFNEKIDSCKKAGIKDIIIDPGFGFGKTIDHNFQLLNGLNVFNMLGRPLLAGLSRKSTIYKTLGITAAEALNGTTVLNTLALEKGAAILRVHDVKEASQAITLFNKYKENAALN